jgi:DNA repair protein RadC
VSPALRAYRGKGARLLVDVVREGGLDPLAGRAIRSGSCVANMIAALHDAGRVKRDREAVGTVLLDARHRVMAVDVCSVGVHSAAPVSPALLLRPAVVAASPAVVLWHTHPSGDVSPSDDDQVLTDRVREAGQLLGLQVLDHVVVGVDSGLYWSFSDGKAHRFLRFVQQREGGVL